MNLKDALIGSFNDFHRRGGDIAGLLMLRRSARRAFHAITTTTAASSTARRSAVAIAATGLKVLAFPWIALLAAFREVAPGTAATTTAAARPAIKVAEVAIASRFTTLFFCRPVERDGLIAMRLALLVNQRGGSCF
jgi:hypothetical protein